VSTGSAFAITHIEARFSAEVRHRYAENGSPIGREAFREAVVEGA
jgi:hypothetical protein